MTIDRRRFIQRSAGLSATGAIAAALPNQPLASGAEPVSNSADDDSNPDGQIRFIATWPFGKFACEKALEIASSGTMLDAIEQGIWVTESDVKNASVGIGGIPNATGQVELDACFMSGPDHNAGSVAGIQDILHPISVARAVMERTPHVMLVGQGALDFALENGFSKTNLLTEKQKEKWQDWKTEQAKESAGEAESNELDQSNESNKSQQPLINEDLHDTIAMLGIDAEGNLYGGCSTSGWGYKIPGRVGDSPIIGSGLYVDNKVGAAGATGLGENVMRHCGSFLVVEMMRWGASPTAACELAIKRIAENDPKNLDNLDINFIAINKDGETGAAGTSKGFKYSVTDAKKSKVLKAKSLSEKPIGPEGGNTK